MIRRLAVQAAGGFVGGVTVAIVVTLLSVHADKRTDVATARDADTLGAPRTGVKG